MWRLSGIQIPQLRHKYTCDGFSTNKCLEATISVVTGMCHDWSGACLASRGLGSPERDELVRLLLRLPPGQRAAIVLRYWEDLSEAQAAEVLGCSPGTVRSATSRGLRRLRELSGTMPAVVTDQGGRTR
jgi:hypothetical protein